MPDPRRPARTTARRGARRRDRHLADRPDRPRSRPLTRRARRRAAPTADEYLAAPPARAGRVPELQAPDDRGADARRSASPARTSSARSWPSPTTSTAPSRPGRRRLADDPLGRGHRRHRPQAARPPRERGRDARSTRRPGTPFDPREHEAIANVPGHRAGPEGEIVDEIRRGYRLRDRVIRPALVAVAAGQRHRPTTATHRPPPN